VYVLRHEETENGLREESIKDLTTPNTDGGCHVFQVGERERYDRRCIDGWSTSRRTVYQTDALRPVDRFGIVMRALRRNSARNA